MQLSFLGGGPARQTPGLGARIAGQTGWRRAGLAFGAGLASALSTAPFGLWPILAVTFPVLVLLLDGADGPRRLRAAAAAGWWFGFGYFLASLWWIGAAFLVDADDFGWLLPFAVISLPAGLAMFTALGAVLARLMWSSGWGRLFAFAAGLALAEWLRGHVLTGFPWNTFGYALAENLALAQSAAVIGLWGLTFASLLLFSSPVLLLSPAPWPRRVIGPAAAVLVLALAFGAGSYRLAATPTQFVAGLHLRVMQANVPQDNRFSYDRREFVLADYLALSARPSATYPQGLADVNVLIWPESAFPFIYEREPWAAERIRAALPENVTLVTGAARYDTALVGLQSPFFNAIRVIDSHGMVRQTVDKVHLVPFGEYLPFQAFLERMGLEQLTRVKGGFSAGARLKPLALPGNLAAGPLICYEAIFPGAVLPQGPRPGLLLNLTNDAWFGETPGPYQHFLQARLRAIEEGLPLVRAANSGISAIVDPLGRIVASLPLGAQGLLDGEFPKPMEKAPFGADFSSAVFTATLLAAIALALSQRRRIPTPIS